MDSTRPIERAPAEVIDLSVYRATRRRAESLLARAEAAKRRAALLAALLHRDGEDRNR